MSRFAARAPSAATIPLWPLVLYVQVRTRVIDDVFRSFVAREGAQVVILGAGYDCRAARFASELGGARVLEVDHPRTQARKRQVLERAGIADARVTYVPWDFEARDVGELPQALAALGHDATRPTLAIWEGVTMYLSEPAIEATVAAVRELSAADSLLVLTYFDRVRIERPGAVRSLIAKVVASGGEPFRFGWSPAELPSWLRARGYGLEWDRTVKSFADELLPSPYDRLVRESHSHIACARVIA